MGMGIFRIDSDNLGEVFNRFLVFFYHLIGFRPFMDVAYVYRDPSDTECERKNSFFKFLNPTVR